MRKLEKVVVQNVGGDLEHPPEDFQVGLVFTERPGDFEGMFRTAVQLNAGFSLKETALAFQRLSQDLWDWGLDEEFGRPFARCSHPSPQDVA